jgi:hypothetical protein
LKLADLLVLNPGLTDNSLLKVGQELNITALKPFIDVIVEKELNQKEEIPFQNEVINDESLPKGETREKQAGINGLQTVSYKTLEQDGVTVKKDIINQQIQQQPVSHIVVKAAIFQVQWDIDGANCTKELTLRDQAIRPSKQPIMAWLYRQAGVAASEIKLLLTTKMGLRPFMDIYRPLVSMQVKRFHRDQQSELWVQPEMQQEYICTLKYIKTVSCKTHLTI